MGVDTLAVKLKTTEIRKNHERHPVASRCAPMWSKSAQTVTGQTAGEVDGEDLGTDGHCPKLFSSYFCPFPTTCSKISAMWSKSCGTAEVGFPELRLVSVQSSGVGLLRALSPRLLMMKAAPRNKRNGQTPRHPCLIII